jgi:sortase A
VEFIKITDPQDVAVLRSTPEPSLTLITCYPFGYLGSAPERFVVLAREIH